MKDEDSSVEEDTSLNEVETRVDRLGLIRGIEFSESN